MTRTAALTTIGMIILLVALTGGAFNLARKNTHQDRDHPRAMPIRTASNPGEERQSINRRSRAHDPEAGFLMHLAQIEPITDFDEPSDGYFKAYLLMRDAENLLKQGDPPAHQGAVLELLEKSYAYFLGVREAAPDWKDRMVLTRLEKTRDHLREAYFAHNSGERTSKEN